MCAPTGHSLPAFIYTQLLPSCSLLFVGLNNQSPARKVHYIFVFNTGSSSLSLCHHTLGVFATQIIFHIPSLHMGLLCLYLILSLPVLCSYSAQTTFQPCFGIADLPNSLHSPIRVLQLSLSHPLLTGKGNHSQAGLLAVLWWMEYDLYFTLNAIWEAAVGGSRKLGNKMPIRCDLTETINTVFEMPNVLLWFLIIELSPLSPIMPPW